MRSNRPRPEGAWCQAVSCSAPTASGSRLECRPRIQVCSVFGSTTGRRAGPSHVHRACRAGHRRRVLAGREDARVWVRRTRRCSLWDMELGEGGIGGRWTLQCGSRRVGSVHTIRLPEGYPCHVAAFVPRSGFVLAFAFTGPAADDRYGDPIPAGAKARLGTARMRSALGGGPTAITPDGKFLVGPAAQGGVAFYDPATGKVARLVKIDGEFSSPVSFSADGKRGAQSRLR